MGVRIGTGLSSSADLPLAVAEAAAAARDGIQGGPCDLAVVFASGAHLRRPQELLEQVHGVLEPEDMAGCGAAGVLAHGREIEDDTAVSVWAASLGDGWCETFHATVEPAEGGGALAGTPDLAGASGVVLLTDPFSFPTDAVLRFLAGAVPGVPVLGGVASARTAEGGMLFRSNEVLFEGAIGIRFDGVELLPCVSQGAKPIGPELTVTAGEGNVIHELAGKPALERLRDAVEQLRYEDRRLLESGAGGLLIGIVIDPGKPEFLQGDFLVRPLVGADPDNGSVQVGAIVEPGQIVRLHVRDAASAHRDLQQALDIRMQALGGETPAGALVFACNGRGRDLFGHPDHDAEMIARELAGAPAAGFFCAGEIGPVGGESFLHGYTATLAVFAA